MGTLAGIVIAAITIFILTDTLYAGIIKPALHSDTGSFSYNKFQELTTKVQDLLNSQSQTATDKMILELEPEYRILGFQYDKETRACASLTILKPKQCEDKGCMCLFKGELESDNKEKNINDKKIVGKCFTAENTKFYSRFFSDYENYGYPTCADLPVRAETIGNLKYKDVSIIGYIDRAYIGGDEEGYLRSMKLLVYIKNLPDNTKQVFIDIESDENKLIYKTTNYCPDNSPSECKGKHYDSVFKEEGQSFVCKFKEEMNKCVKEKISDCSSGVIWKECACGEVAYDSGFCVNGKYAKNDFPTDYCYLENIGSCEDYEEGDYENKEYACVFNICNVDNIGCYWDTEGGAIDIIGLKPNACESCQDECDCEIYEEDWLKEIDPCNCCV